ncbi:MAG: hypothetical protein HYV27_22670 [Candidatus Hydrogenedentes bacterium]|nr:hypothetical protein [Candidatus Hydrogenedentota bacterium]
MEKKNLLNARVENAFLKILISAILGIVVAYLLLSCGQISEWTFNLIFSALVPGLITVLLIEWIVSPHREQKLQEEFLSAVTLRIPDFISDGKLEVILDSLLNRLYDPSLVADFRHHITESISKPLHGIRNFPLYSIELDAITPDSRPYLVSLLNENDWARFWRMTIKVTLQITDPNAKGPFHILLSFNNQQLSNAFEASQDGCIFREIVRVPEEDFQLIQARLSNENALTPFTEWVKAVDSGNRSIQTAQPSYTPEFGLQWSFPKYSNKRFDIHLDLICPREAYTMPIVFREPTYVGTVALNLKGSGAKGDYYALLSPKCDEFNWVPSPNESFNLTVNRRLFPDSGFIFWWAPKDG